MARYIDADKVLQELGDAPLNWTNSDAEMQEQSDHKLFKIIVESQPTADVAEVKHGEWLKSNPYNRFMNCSVCGFGQDHTNFKYCPNCGAKMDGDE